MRNVDAGALLELFLVYAIAAILVIRASLGATGYPQIGGRGLHISHMLWGGLLMLITIVMLVAFLGKSVVRLGAILGGLGFGIFIDELGKFITSDNDYFFQPTIALIYAIFVGLFFAFRAIDRRHGLTRRDALVNAIDLLKEAARGDLDDQEKQQALALLSRSGPNDAMVPGLTAILRSATAEPDRGPGLIARLARWSRRVYGRLVRLLWFAPALVAIFALLAVLDLASVARVILSDPSFRTTHPHLSFVDWADLISSATFAGMVVAGITRLRASRLNGYSWLRRAILISIFFSQVFYFYSEQMLAVIGLAISLLLLAALNTMISAEQVDASPTV